MKKTPKRAVKKTGTRSTKRTSSPRRSIAAPERPEAEIQNDVEIDEARERVGEPLEAFHLETSEGTDALAEQLGEEFVENVTGADDAASVHRGASTFEENGGPFVYTTGATEYSASVDDTNPLDAPREALPTVS